MAAATPGMVEIAAVTIFAIALLHTFSTQHFQHSRPRPARHAGLWHLLGEVEVVFGFWAMVLLIFLVTYSGASHALHYLESRNFTEPAFVFVIMVIAASRPIIDLAGAVAALDLARAAAGASRRLLLHACFRSARCSVPSSPSRQR